MEFHNGKNTQKVSKVMFSKWLVVAGSVTCLCWTRYRMIYRPRNPLSQIKEPHPHHLQDVMYLKVYYSPLPLATDDPS